MTSLLLAGALFAYAYPADAYTYRVTLEGEGYASPLLGEGRLEGRFELRYRIVRRPADPEPGEARFEPDKVDLRWNGGRLPVVPEVLDRLFRSRTLAFRAEGLVPSTEPPPALSASLGPVAVASLLPPLVLFPSRLPAEARVGSSWTEADANAPFRRDTTLTAIELDALALTQRIEPKPGSQPEYRGTGTVRLDRGRGVATSSSYDLQITTAQGENKRLFALRASVSEVRPVVVRPSERSAPSPVQAARGWFDDAVRWSGDRLADLRGYWTMLEVAFRMSVGRLTDPEPLLGALRRRLGLPGAETR